MIVQPEHITAAMLDKALEALRRKKNSPALDKVRLERYDEDRAAHIRHPGPYSAEGPTVARLIQYVQEKGYVIRARHHEIYLSDPRRTAPEKMKTLSVARSVRVSHINVVLWPCRRFFPALRRQS